MFLLVHVVFSTLPAPGVFAFNDADGGPWVDGATSFFADEVAGVVVGAVGDLAAHVVGAVAVFEFVEDAEVVEHITGPFSGSCDSPADGVGLNGGCLVGPVDPVDCVDGLFDNVFAGEVVEGLPVSELPFHVGPFGLTGDVAERAGVVSALDGTDLTDGSVVELFEGIAHLRCVSPAETGDEREVFLFCEECGFDDGAHTGCIDPHRFFAEDMFAGFDRGANVHGPEYRGCGKEYDMDVGSNELFVSVEADESGLVGDGYAIG